VETEACLWGSFQGTGKASDCIGCGVCEKNCPQMLPIRDYLQKVKEVLE